MKKSVLTLLSIALMLNICYAQLNKLCPISSTVYDKESIASMNLLLGTKDYLPALIATRKTSMTSTVQLVRVTQPFPPLWFQMGNPETDTGSFVGTTFLLDTKIQKSTGNLTFMANYPGKFYGVVTFDTATLNPIDSTQRYKTSNPISIKQFIDLHDFQMDAVGNKLFVNQKLVSMDIRCLSGVDKDSAKSAMINEILILNPNDSIIFRWNPLAHLSPCDMFYEYRNSSLSYGEILNWSHANSVRFANDGNIIYSFRHIGMGKINRKTGEIMWRLGGKKTPNTIILPDSINYFLQHDFSQREDGLYAVFSNGDSAHQYLEGLVYDIDEKKKTARLVSRYRPKPDIYSRALGSYDCHGDTCIIDFGMYVQDIPTYNQEMAHILIKDKIVAKLSGPVMHASYQIHPTKWEAIQRRPKIKLAKTILTSDSPKDLHSYVWYKIEGTTATPVGNGNTFEPTVSGNYVVEAQQGIGLFRSYLISDVFSFTK